MNNYEFIRDDEELEYKTVRKCLEDYATATEQDLRTAFELTYYDPDKEETITFSEYHTTLDYFRRSRGSWFFESLTLGGYQEKIGVALQRWWARRKDTYGWLDMALKDTDYNPIENYDRKEEGGWKDDHDIGARSGTDNLTDTYAATQKTTTETPGVTETVEDTFGASQRTETETPRAETTTTTTPGVVTTTDVDVYGDNSTTDVPQSKTTVTPDATTPDVVTVAGTAGTNTTVTADLQKIDTHETSFEGFNQTIEAELQHIDTHNRATGSLAAKDTDTRLFQNYRVHGNIGVSTVADILSKEVSLRKDIDLPLMALNEFLDLYTFYVE